MAITSIFNGNKQSNNVATNSNNNTRDAVQPDSLKDFLILQKGDASRKQSDNNDPVQAVQESVHSMQNQAKEGAENVKSTMEDATQQIREQFKDQSNARNTDKDQQSDTALFKAIQDKTLNLKDTLMGATSSSTSNNTNTNDETPIKDQIKDKAEDMRETADDAASAVQYSTLHFAHAATDVTGLHTGKEKDTIKDSGNTEQPNSVLGAVGEVKDSVYNYLVDAKDTLVAPQEHSWDKPNHEANNKQNAGEDIADTASQFKDKLMSISQDKSSDKQSTEQLNPVIGAVGEVKDSVYDYLMDAKDTLVAPQEHSWDKPNDEANNKQNAGENIADTASQFKDKVMSISQDKSSDKQSKNLMESSTEQPNPVMGAAGEIKDSVYDYLVDAKDTLVAPQEHSWDKPNHEVNNKQNAGENIADTAGQFKDKVMSISQDKSSDKQSNGDQDTLLQSLKTKADEGRSVLNNQLDGLKDTIQGNTAEAKGCSASAKTQLAEREMKEAYNLMGKATKDKRDATQMRTDQSANLVERASENNDGTILQDGKHFVADYVTDKTIEAKEGLGSRKQDLASELFQDAKTMAAEAMQDASKAAELRTKTTDKQQ